MSLNRSLLLESFVGLTVSMLKSLTGYKILSILLGDSMDLSSPLFNDSFLVIA